MSLFKRKKLAVITTIYWFMLVYIIAALVWWFIELESQNRHMAFLETELLQHIDNPAEHDDRLAAIKDQQRRHTAQYVAEGLTFLVLIMIGAVYIYRSVRNQIRLQVQQQNFMMAVTHELKTPIAVAQLNLETLRKHALDEQKRNRLIDITLNETNRLNQLATNILVSAQLEGGRYTLVREKMDLSSRLLEIVQQYQQRFPERTWIIDIHSGITIEGDELLLQMLLNNLLENAYKYSPNGSVITTKLYQEGRLVVLDIYDEGMGIPDNEKKNVFKKFYRIGSEQTRSAKGTGLGLHLCKKIADDHSARISILDNTPKGSIFRVRFSSK